MGALDLMSRQPQQGLAITLEMTRLGLRAGGKRISAFGASGLRRRALSNTFLAASVTTSPVCKRRSQEDQGGMRDNSLSSAERQAVGEWVLR